MAVTIIQQPSSPAYSISDIVYTVDSDQKTQAEFNYVADISIGGTMITRLIQVADPSGFGVYQPSRIIDDLLEFDTDALGQNNVVSTRSTKDITISFREQFLATDGTIRLTDVTATSTIKYIKGVKPVGISLNSTIAGLLSSDLEEFSLNRNDTMTLSYYGAISSITVTSGSTTQSIGVTNTAGNLRHIGIGPNQIISLGTSSIWTPVFNNSATESYSVSILASGSVVETINIALNHTRDRSETRFAWQNEKGGIDYFTCNQSHSQSASITNRSYLTTPIIIGSAGNAVTATPNNSKVINTAQQVYRKSFEEIFTANSEWLEDDQAALLQGLFDSRSAYVEIDGIFHPIVITSPARETRTHNREHLLFQYEVQYQFSNQKRTV